jgi:hypothetical protein
VLVVEHDAEMMRSARSHSRYWSGGRRELGGRLIYEGDFPGLIAIHNR